MTGDSGPLLVTDRLRLRPWCADEAAVLRELWAERDPRVPAHRRLDADGRPWEVELRASILTSPSMERLLAVQRADAPGPIGYCGWVPAGPDGREPELAFELLPRWQGQGYATEAGRAVIDHARAEGLTQLWATVWDWNTASRRVLAKLGFVETGQVGAPGPHGVSLLTTRRL